MAIRETQSPNHKHPAYLSWAGIALIVTGVVVALDQFIKTGWLILVILPVIGLVLLAEGIHAHKFGFVIPGCLLTGLGIGTFLTLRTYFDSNWAFRVGIVLITFSLGWLAITGISIFLFKKTPWWSVLVGAALLSSGITFLFTSLNLLDFVLYCSIAIGIVFILWGYSSRLLGLIIPGCLVISIGPGIYQGWHKLVVSNGLAQTGVMLVWFALGWGLITVFSRILTDRFTWWPLIPGGIFAMVGTGLYIGGNPANAVTFLGNTGSVGLVIFGIYLLLLRKGIRG